MMKTLELVRELRGSRFRLLQADVPASRIEDVAREYAARQEGDRDKLERMAGYAQSAMCRWKLLLQYFNEGDDFDGCGSCDNCVEPPEARLSPPVDRMRSPIAPASQP
jgi:ATP-dependent DNA helicase RecQ